LNRYIKFIENCKIKNVNYFDYTEKHHICPKAKDMFPEYKSLTKNKWNKVDLTPRQHIIAHTMLYYAYNDSYSPKIALFRMIHANGVKINSRIYEAFRKAHSLSISKRYKGRISKNRDKIAVFKGEKRTFIDKNLIEKYLLNGYTLGMNFSKEHKENMKKNEGKVIINDGNYHKYIYPYEKLPEGWIYGRLPDTEETKLKKSKSKIGKIGNALNHVTVKDKDGNTLSVMKDDPRLLDGTLSGINKGKTGLANHLNQKNHMCEYCGFTTTIGNYKRWHGEKCKSRF
jgi:hypothetical protein